MRIKRSMSDEEWELFRRDPTNFFAEEAMKIVQYLTKYCHLKTSNELRCLGVVTRSGEILIDVDVYNKPNGPNISPVFISSTENIDIDPLMADETTGGYRLTAFLPGVKEDEVDVYVRDDVLTISTGNYSRSFVLPERISEMRKTYNHGMLDIRLA